MEYGVWENRTIATANAWRKGLRDKMTGFKEAAQNFFRRGDGTANLDVGEVLGFTRDDGDPPWDYELFERAVDATFGRSGVSEHSNGEKAGRMTPQRVSLRALGYNNPRRRMPNKRGGR